MEYLVVAQAGDPETSPSQLTLEGGWHKPTFLVKKGGRGWNKGSCDRLHLDFKVIKYKARSTKHRP